MAIDEREFIEQAAEDFKAKDRELILRAADMQGTEGARMAAMARLVMDLEARVQALETAAAAPDDVDSEPAARTLDDHGDAAPAPAKRSRKSAATTPAT